MRGAAACAGPASPFLPPLPQPWAEALARLASGSYPLPSARVLCLSTGLLGIALRWGSGGPSAGFSCLTLKCQDAFFSLEN